MHFDSIDTASERRGGPPWFEMLKQSLNAQIEQASADRDGKAGLKSKKIQAKADATGQLQDTTSTRDDDSKYYRIWNITVQH